MELNDILISKKQGQKIGFRTQGGPDSPFKRFCRYSFSEKNDFNQAFRSGKAKLLNEVDVYLEGVIIVNNFNGTNVNFVVEGAGLQPNGKIISKEEFKEFINNINRIVSDNEKMTIDLSVMAQDSDVIFDSEFFQKLNDFIEKNGIESQDKLTFFASFLDYLNGEYKEEAIHLKNILQTWNELPKVENFEGVKTIMRNLKTVKQKPIINRKKKGDTGPGNVMEDLKMGTSFKTKKGETIKILEKLGEGGQGTVYKVSYNGKIKAFKFYHHNFIKNSIKFYQNLENNINKGAPTAAFLWPQDITEKTEKGYGYIMDLCPPEFKEFSLFLLAKEKFASVTAMINSGLYIIEAFRELHNSGYSYQDLNDGNFFVNPKNGEVLICDNDNVVEYGKNLGVAGKCRYMAPEVVIGKALPSVHTDKYSLAVILFLLLMGNHPLEGKRAYIPCTTEEIERKIYGEEPLFIFDRDDTSNGPVHGINNNSTKRWPLYPSYIREKFMEAFSQTALNDPSKRIIEKEWLKIFIRLRSEIYKCKNCGEIFFADPARETPCHACKTIQRFEHYITLPKMNVAIHERTKLFECHINPDSDDFRSIAAETVFNEATGSFEIKNKSKKTWLRIDANGKQTSKTSGKTVPVQAGTQIIFGNAKGEIK
ncbi:hypothetical protein R84B8_02506 [Treponema sp. R8-4-B8]